MSENNCAVYVHINLINGKKYVGITTQNPPERRWSNGNGYKDNTHFTRAIKKYGWSNFCHFILYRDVPIKIAKNIEEMLIREHMSYDPRFGYNKTYGGELEKPTKETLMKISGENSPSKRPDVRKKMSEARKEYYKNNPEARIEARKKAINQWSDPKKREELLKLKTEQFGKPVIRFDKNTGEITGLYESVREAGRITGVDHSYIIKVCKFEREAAGGSCWCYVSEVME